MTPRTAVEVEDAVRHALAHDLSLDIRGGGTKLPLGRPMQTSQVIDVSSLSGIIAYEPEELVLTAKPGTRMEEIDALLTSKRQMLAFEPPDYGAVLGTAPNSATLGGVVSAGISGPRRLKSGAARDHMLGVRAVSGRGEAFMAGGRVVKNVTGYDLPKLITGSYGTLAVMTELTLKVMPAPESETTLLILGLSEEGAVRAMTEAMQSSYDVSGAAHLPHGLDANSMPATLLRVEGVSLSVASRVSSLSSTLALADMTEITAERSRSVWRDIRDLTAFIDQAIIWRLSLPPANADKTVAHIRKTIPSARTQYDWGGALVWIGLQGAETHTALIRDAAARAGGQAQLFKASAEMRQAENVFSPLPAPLFALTKRVKDQFDPKRVLNPGRMFSEL